MRGRPLRLVDAPVELAHTTRRWLHEVVTVHNGSTRGDHHTVVADQVRELSVALGRTMRGLTAVVDQVLSTVPPAMRGRSGRRTVTVDLAGTPTGTREAAEIVATIDHLAAAGGSPMLAVPADARSLVDWIAREIDTQSDGQGPTAYTAGHRLFQPPCGVLRAATSHDLGQATIHAFRHTGFTPRQVDAVRASQVSATLAQHPGASLDQLVLERVVPRVDLLNELGELIDLRAIFGIDHRWYPYDITVLALLDPAATRRGCGCPSTAS